MDKPESTTEATATDPVAESIDGKKDERPNDPQASPVDVNGTFWVVLISLCAAAASLVQVALEQPERGYFVLSLTMGVCGAAVFLDVATRSIPNKLTVPAILLGLSINCLLSPVLVAAEVPEAVSWLGSPLTVDSLMGFGVCTAFVMVSFAMRGLGGGDAKLVMAFGALLGLSEVTAVLFHALLIAAVIGVVNWAVRGTLIARLQIVTQNLMMAAFSDSKFKGSVKFTKKEAPFGLSLFLGLILAQRVQLHHTLIDAVIELR